MYILNKKPVYYLFFLFIISITLNSCFEDKELNSIGINKKPEEILKLEKK